MGLKYRGEKGHFIKLDRLSEMTCAVTDGDMQCPRLEAQTK